MTTSGAHETVARLGAAEKGAMGRGGLLLPMVCLGACSCASGDDLHWLETPPFGDAKSMLLVVESEELRVEAFDLSGGELPARRFVTSPGAPFRATALLLGAALEDLGLDAGAIPAKKAGETGRHLPLEDLRAVYESDGRAPWRKLEAPAREVREFEASPSSFVRWEAGCGFRERELEAWEIQSGLELVIPIEERSAFLVGTKVDGFALVDPALGTVQPVSSSTSAHRWMLGGIRDAQGRIWIGTGGQLVEARLEGDRLEVVQTHPLPQLTGATPRWLAASDAGSAFELFGIAERSAGEPGPFYRFDGEQAEVLDELVLGTGSVAWIGPGEALATSNNELEMIRYRDGAVSTEALPIGDTDSPNTLARIAGLGTLLGTRLGFVYLEQEGRAWRHLLGPLEAGRPHRILSSPGGFVFLADDGLGRYTPELGTCFCLSCTTNGARLMGELHQRFYLAGIRDPTMGPALRLYEIAEP